MGCPDCEAATVAFRVPDDLRESASVTADAVAVCTRCLAVHDADEPPAEQPDPRAISDALPADPDAALALLLAASLLESLASNRRAIGPLIRRAERGGVDPALAFERLAADPDLEPAVDLARRHRQFEQLRD